MPLWHVTQEIRNGCRVRVRAWTAEGDTEAEARRRTQDYARAFDGGGPKGEVWGLGGEWTVHLVSRVGVVPADSRKVPPMEKL